MKKEPTQRDFGVGFLLFLNKKDTRLQLEKCSRFLFYQQVMFVLHCPSGHIGRQRSQHSLLCRGEGMGTPVFLPGSIAGYFLRLCASATGSDPTLTFLFGLSRNRLSRD